MLRIEELKKDHQQKNGELKGRYKSRFSITFILVWHCISVFTWAVFLILLNELNLVFINNFPETLILTTILTVLTFGLLQELLLNQYISIFPYWLITIFLGIFIGIFYTILMIGTFVFFTILGGNFVIWIYYSINHTAGVVLSFFVGAIGSAIALIIYTYGFYYGIIKRILNSKRVSEKFKIILESTIIYAFSIFLTFVVTFMSVILFHEYLLFLSLISMIIFSLFTYSGFKDLFTENNISNAFKSKH